MHAAALGNGVAIDPIAFVTENSHSARGSPIPELSPRAASGTSAAANTDADAAARGGDPCARCSSDDRRDASRVHKRERFFDGVETSLVVDSAAGRGGVNQPQAALEGGRLPVQLVPPGLPPASLPPPAVLHEREGGIRIACGGIERRSRKRDKGGKKQQSPCRKPGQRILVMKQL